MNKARHLPGLVHLIRCSVIHGKTSSNEYHLIDRLQQTKTRRAIPRELSLHQA